MSKKQEIFFKIKKKRNSMMIMGKHTKINLIIFKKKKVLQRD